MKANNIIINREAALSILNAAEKRCSARTFGDLEAIEAALKDLLAEKGYAKTCNSKLKGVRAIVGETTGEYMYIEYSKRHSYPNSNKTTFVHLSHNGKGWKLIKAERDYTNKYSRIDTSNTKEAIEAKKERELSIEEAEKQLSEYAESRIGSLTLADAEGVGRSLEAVVRSVIEKEKGYKELNVEHIEERHALIIKYWSDELHTRISATALLPEDSLFCENCTNCKYCYFCKDCKDCTNCRYCTDCSRCEDVRFCNNCADCHHTIDCSFCENCDDCRYCTGCVNCTDCIACKDFTGCVKGRECNDYKDSFGTHHVKYDGDTYFVTVTH